MTAPAQETSAKDPGPAAFAVHLDVFEGPFDLLLSLISKRRLDVTLVALSQVTDEFITFIRAQSDDLDLDVASSFLVVAATLLDLKVSRLLPGIAVADEEDLALLEARDLLFARLLQYRAYRQIADWIAERWLTQARAWPRSVSLEPAFAHVLPEVVIGATPDSFPALLARASAERQQPIVDVGHLHAPTVSVREQAAVIAERLRSAGRLTFRHLVADCETTLVIVARFMALLELYREGLVLFDQLEPLGELQVRWSGPTGADELPEIGIDDDSDFETAAGEPLGSDT